MHRRPPPGRRRGRRDRLSSAGWDVDYQLGESAGIVLESIGVDLDALLESPRRRPLLRYCVDWSEQHHHLAGALGAGVLDAFLRAGWIRRARAGRAVHVTADGERALRTRLDVRLDDPTEAQCSGTGTKTASSR